MKLFLIRIRTKKKRRELDVLVHARGKVAAEKHVDAKFTGSARQRTIKLGNTQKHFVVAEYED